MPTPGAIRTGIATAVTTLLCLTATPTAAFADTRPGPISFLSSRDRIATAYQINANHDGNAGAAVVAPPLRRHWSRDLGGSVSYPIIAEQRVFVTARQGDEYGTTLYALDAATGANAWPPVKLGGTYWYGGLTYGAGRLFALNFDGRLTAFSAATGAPLWTRELGNAYQYDFASMPTYRNGIVYFSSSGVGGTLYAINAYTGYGWARPVANGQDSSPAVTDTAVFASYGCPRVYRFEVGTGTQQWEYNSTCTGGGGLTPVLADGAVWVRDVFSTAPTVLNQSDGEVRALFGARFERANPPAFLGRTGFFVTGTAMQARPTTSPLQALWTFTGDGGLLNAPIIAGGYVYVGSETGMLWAVDPATGRAVWSTQVGAPIYPPNERGGGSPRTGMGAGQGRLIVPAANLLVSYGG
ncbi:PQQ-binding-like beta-propeller repeat protein [Micromonospora purpureochromogenes]|uniref:Outer membrane protein assembly factor BamB n=1 Tax=Micromonospora purpureochromogenes TaxID=47872 RepID=A0ABX2RCD8_9ACTN|nr:PQQ-binding-like beta-propeller repeat protein [Micromonospora purpureochromogenes]NYF54184.1 outer membrane protein assembly factor BamB [Micromonospora purpureochromogenes]